MKLEGGTRFDFVRFFVIFLVWIIGAWAIIFNVNKIEREGLYMFDGTLGIERQERKIKPTILGEENVIEEINGGIQMNEK